MSGNVLWVYGWIVMGGVVPAGACIWLFVTLAPLRRSSPRSGTADGLAILGVAGYLLGVLSVFDSSTPYPWIVAPLVAAGAVGLLLVLSRAARCRMGDEAASESLGREAA